MMTNIAAPDDWRDAESPPRNLALFAILGVYLIISTLYNVAIPIGEAPDEPGHIDFVQIMLKTGQLPTIPKESPRYSYEAQQPPLYYLLQSGWLSMLWPNNDLLPDLKPNPDFSFARDVPPNVYLHNYPPARAVPAHLMRLLSTLLGLLTLLFTWWSARLAWPESSGAAVVATGFVAFLPGFTFTSATVTNDSIAATCGTAVLFACAYMLRRGPTVWAALLAGSALGLGLLSKHSLLVMVPVVIVTPFLAPASTRRQQLTTAAISLFTALLLGAWSFVSNFLTYGDPFATAAIMAAKSDLTSPLERYPGLWLSPAYHWFLYNSLWGSFGLRSIDLPDLLYFFYYILCMFALFGFIRHRRDLDSTQRRVAFIALLAFLLINIGVAYLNMQFWAVQGRLLLPGLAALALLLGKGLSLVGQHLFPSARSKRIATAVLLALLVALNLYALVGFIVYVYYV